MGVSAPPAWASVTGKPTTLAGYGVASTDALFLALGASIATTSGTAADFTGIPAGTKMIIISFNGVSTNGTSALLVQLGDSGGVENTGYLSNVGQINSGGTNTGTSAAGFLLNTAAGAVNIFSGSIILTLVNSSTNAWIAVSLTNYNSINAMYMQAGNKALSAVLDRVRITMVNGTDAFDAGEVNILYK